jgi:hypothetical protein
LSNDLLFNEIFVLNFLLHHQIHRILEIFQLFAFPLVKHLSGISFINNLILNLQNDILGFLQISQNDYKSLLIISAYRVAIPCEFFPPVEGRAPQEKSFVRASRDRYLTKDSAIFPAKA